MLHEYLTYIEHMNHIIDTFLYVVLIHLSRELWIKQAFPKENLLYIQFTIHMYKDGWFENLNGSNFFSQRLQYNEPF